VLEVEDWAEIRRLHRAERRPIKAIVRVMGVSRNTVRRAIAAQAPPHYERASRGSIVDDSSRGSASCCRPGRRCQRP